MTHEEILKTRIADYLKSYRKQRKLSLDAVAKLTGVSKAMLGQIERMESCPTIAKLWQISSGLGTSFSAFLSSTETSAILNHDDFVNDPDMQITTLNRYDTSVGFEMLEVTLFNHHRQTSSPHSNGVVETIWVKNGKLQLFADNKWIELNPGDTHRFHADQQHEYRALTPIVTFHNIISYPN
ncbi:helix-turn-helix domain-containing protein [Vibrio viridaestus]|uniref:XRE family transcriptional regulator n=1 Tax=Vibrio viridaestus TaxID=2487322 RepID=A0A3N9TKW6_9VIBR|nr:XRE family transcriptional regulator [Vibrio viridaestus]RQW64761.1 XRE family transcriptional regulator [Vibrio viridaestus]